MSNSDKNPLFYCVDPSSYNRLTTREVAIGHLPIGAANPIRVQSMTTTDTMDTMATVEQSIRIVEAGGEYVRITAPSKKEAENLAAIKKELRARGYDVPLIADIHFTPNAAEIAARIVEKVRVNPGNYADKKKFEFIEYTDAAYDEEIARIRKRFTPLVKICKEEGTAMRIGTNHGSLSDRIMSRYGDSPMGMVESALEFVRICEAESYYDLVLSMKASNTRVMVQAYRLLVNRMAEENMSYPLHLGVTEAGDGEDGRIKSAVGIGSLLADGIGDTVRVSLTEAPEAECPVAQDLINRYPDKSLKKEAKKLFSFYDPFSYSRLKTETKGKIGGDQIHVVFADYSQREKIVAADLKEIGYRYDADLDKWHIDDQAADYLILKDQQLNFEIPGTLQLIFSVNELLNPTKLANKNRIICSYEKASAIRSSFKGELFIEIDNNMTNSLNCAELISLKPSALVINTTSGSGIQLTRILLAKIREAAVAVPLILKFTTANACTSEVLLAASCDLGAFLVDGIGDGAWLSAPNLSATDANRLSFGILQATRSRISKTEYISCPSCGRTLFDLEETTALIRSRTHHLKGVKIGIMGCIVNGPGEMADADYGYVGSGVGKITLYRGQEVVKRNIPSENAVDKLIDIIREDGNWVELLNN